MTFSDQAVTIPSTNVPIGDVGLNETEHLLGGAGCLDKHTVVDLEKTEELQNFAGLGGDFIDTVTWSMLVSQCAKFDSPPNTDDEVHLGLSRDVEVTSSPGSALQANLLFLLRQVLLNI